MAGFGAKLIGAKVVANTFKRMSDNAMPNLTIAMKKIVLMIERRAKQLAPVDSGRLRNSIKGIVERIALTAIKGEVGTDVDYAIFVHEGHTSGGTFISAKPFLRQALRELRPQIHIMLKKAIFLDFGKVI